MEKDNYKYIDKLVRNKKLSEEEKHLIVCDVIDIHLVYVGYKKMYIERLL